MMTRWMLVFEDPESATVWLAKGAPRNWLEDGKKISVSDAPTKWGRLGFSLTSRLDSGRVEAQVQLPAAPFQATVKLRLRAPQQKPIRSVRLNGKAWPQFDPQDETVVLPLNAAGKISLTIYYN